MNPYEANKVAVSIALLQANLNNSDHAKRNTMLTAIHNLQCIAVPGSPDEAKKHEVKNDRRSIHVNSIKISPRPWPLDYNEIDRQANEDFVHSIDYVLKYNPYKLSWFSKLLKRISK